MARIILNIPDKKIEKVQDAIMAMCPMNPGETYNKQQWLKEATRRWIRNTVATWKQQKEINSIKFTIENDLIS